MSDNKDFSVPEIAAFIVGIAKEKGYISNSLAVAPELVDNEKTFLSWLTVQIRDYVNAKKTEQLEEQEILQLFNFVYAKGCQTAYQWQQNGELPNFEGEAVFDNRIACHIDGEMFEYFNSIPLAVEFSAAFQEWTSHNPDYYQKHGVHPVLPLLECLKWTYRITLSLAFDYLNE